MNYAKIYYAITTRAKGRKKELGLENHHILPASCGGTNNKDNLVYLSTKEHLLCHLLLVKIYQNNLVFKKKMIYALWWMSKTARLKGVRVTGRLYEYVREQYNNNHPNKDIERKKKFAENLKAGVYKYNYEKVSTSLKNYISTLTSEEKLERMRKSALSGDQKKRAESIKKGKGSRLQLIKLDNSKIEFWSYDDVYLITGYTYDHIKYKIKTCNGLLSNGSTVQFIEKYKGNDGNIGRKRNKCV
jgi:hypothetical protein